MNIRSMKVAESSPPVTAVPIAFCAAAPAPLCKGKRQRAEEEGQGGHEDGPKPYPDRRQGGLHQFMALAHLVLDELDDQDGVFGRKPDGGQKPDLEVDVVRESPQLDRRHRPHEAERQHQQVDKGDRPALVQRRHG